MRSGGGEGNADNKLDNTGSNRDNWSAHSAGEIGVSFFFFENLE